MSSVTVKRTLLSTKAKAFSIASLVEQGNEAECGQADDNMVKEPCEEGAPCPSSSKKRKLLNYEAVEEKRKPQAILEGRELWECFYRLGTEMIITKSGRRMFPPLRVSFTGLDPNQMYAVVLDVVPLDNKRHRYSYTDSAWFVAGEADPTPPRRVYTHPESPFTGEELARQVLSFERVKLTNNPKDSNGNIILNSMHKYQPRVHLIKNPSETNSEQDLDKSDSFIFPETAFMAVTAYQNHLITRLKIYSNPFAKGFRDTTRLLPSFEEDGYVIQSDDYSRCCDTRESMCCHLSGQLSCYSHDTRDTADHRILSSQETRWACTDECCQGAEFPWRPNHGSGLGYARSLDFYATDGSPYALLSCSNTLSEERLRDY